MSQQQKATWPAVNSLNLNLVCPVAIAELWTGVFNPTGPHVPHLLNGVTL
jgi:hypothetical protein